MSDSRKPRYQELKDLIITQISSGELGPHDRVHRRTSSSSA